MSNSFFQSEEAACRYKRFRPKTHEAIITMVKPHLPGKMFKSALDIACGTGDSSGSLKQIAEEVVGVDRSEAMLKYAKKQCHETHCLDIGDLSSLSRKFELLTVCMAFHWFDPEIAIPAMKVVSQDDGYWLIYNFAYGGHATNEELNRWYQDDYKKRFPPPARGSTSGRELLKNDPELELVFHHEGKLPIRMSSSELVGYLTTQSNVDHQIRGGKDYESVEKDLIAKIESFDPTDSFLYSYKLDLYRFSGR